MSRPEIRFTSSMLQHVALKKTSPPPTSRSPGHFPKALSTEERSAKEVDDETREYFFKAGIDVWYDRLTEFTFPSCTVPLSPQEARLITLHWRSASVTKEFQAYPQGLHDLHHRIQACMDGMGTPTGSQFFVKLSSRSPKDSSVAFEAAARAYRSRVSACTAAEEVDDNARWTMLTEEMNQATAVKDATQSLLLLCSSERISEDLLFALEGEVEGQQQEVAAAAEASPHKNRWAEQVNIVVRAWDPRVTLQSEFRGFCWDGELNCIGQYYHPLYFEELQSVEVQEEIKKDCVACFESIKQKGLPVPNAMIDFAWLGRGKGVILIEINPLSDVLGSFPASTGLFDWDVDRGLIQGLPASPGAGSAAAGGGKRPLELRVRRSKETVLNFKVKCRPEWRDVVYGGQQQPPPQQVA